MGLRERVAYLWRQHDIWISKSALVLLYRRHGIEYAKARVMKKHLMIERDRYLRIRADSAWNLLSLLAKSEPVVFVDETSVAINNLKAKTWQLPHEPIYASRNQSNLKTVTIYGAVCHPSVYDRPLFMTGNGTDGP